MNSLSMSSPIGVVGKNWDKVKLLSGVIEKSNLVGGIKSRGGEPSICV